MIMERMQLAIAHERDPKLSLIGGRLTFVRVLSEEAEDTVTVNCEACGAILRLAKKDKLIDLYWCDRACYEQNPYTEFLPMPDISKLPKRSTTVEKKVCPECGGPAKGRGYTHTEECTANKANAGPKSCCAECGGPSHGRGFKHKKGCSQKCQPYVPKSKQADDEEEILS